MRAISFELSGRTAFFKKPDVNVHTYFTYNNIHKVALLGLLGAIIGLEGHHQQYRKRILGKAGEAAYPEFYEKLKDMKISIIPKGDRGYFPKKIQYFNNSVGYASKEEGGNLIVREQWLENPAWQILLLDDGNIEKNIFDKLEDSLLEQKCVYVPYLGKNDHPATINACQVVDITPVGQFNHIDSLFPEDIVVLDDASWDDEPLYFFREIMPIELNMVLNDYSFASFCYTNREVEKVNSTSKAYQMNHKILAFF